MLCRLQTEVQYPVDTEECFTGSSRNMVPSWYARMLHGLQAGVWCKGACRNIAKSQKGIERGSEGFIEQLVKHREGQHL